MKNISNRILNDSLEPSGSSAGGSQNSPKFTSPHHISNLMQIDCSFADIDASLAFTIISSISNRNESQYKHAMHIFLENCMHKSLQYLRLFKVDPLTSSEKIDLDPSPNEDAYIINNKGEYDRLQYMCDYCKYFMLGNCEKVVSPMDEFTVAYVDENNFAEKFNIIKKRTDATKCNKTSAEYVPINVSSGITDHRILYSRKGYHLKLLIEEMMSNCINYDKKQLTNATLVAKFTTSESEKKLINSNKIIKKIKMSSNTYIFNNDFYTNSFMKYHLLLNDKFEQTADAKKSIITNNASMNRIIKNKEELRNNALKIRDTLIMNFMRYYLSLKDKFDHIYKSRFKSESEIISEELELPVPKEFPSLAQKVLSDNHRRKINADIEIVKNRMSNYLSKPKHINNVPLYKENRLFIKNGGKGYVVDLGNKKNITTSDVTIRSTTLNKIYNTGGDASSSSLQEPYASTSVTSNILPRSFHFISGLSISSGITQINPELVDSESIANIICSLNNKNVSKYLDAISAFTAKFMHKSLQYVRALKVALPSYGTVYRITPTTDEYIIQNNSIYTRLQYMCDYFKYYILESQLEYLAYKYKEDDIEKEFLPLLNAINAEKGKAELQISADFTEEEFSSLPIGEYEELISSIKKECLNLIENRKALIAEIEKNKTEIRLLIRPLDYSNRDMLIKHLMEYYLLIIDEFESLADLEFKNQTRSLTDRFVLPVPRAVAESVRKEINMDERIIDYFTRHRSDFFCDRNTCICRNECIRNSGHVYNIHMIIRVKIMETVIDRMKDYILSLDIKNDGTHNNVTRRQHHFEEMATSSR
ncbi:MULTISPECIES: hypothetical protein [Candidatus Ichthyocystis]|uniref:Putative coiled coil protein n=1 Tax=Candidatus Ichthyocystis hellenicum TaxID=1561003 RepID=A0A0S4M6Q9_9BURK|nr:MULTISPECIES: hypothetical protein [Ichthyocystis]CUT17949.1 putative coiled coil protein [Candidatus Ichthyocystis hellenicum]